LHNNIQDGDIWQNLIWHLKLNMIVMHNDN
jgi:hypothetical protein